jgi:tetratricopeptide (TPR) repeat protein
VIEQLLRAENALALGLLDQAQQIYEQTLAHDPANAIALVGLSRVALERGDERASLGFARRARSIDPQNGQASRMIDRLEEVILERGDAIPQEAPSTTTPMPAPTSPPAATTPPDVAHSPSTAAPEVAPKRRGLLRRLTGRS